MSNNFTLTGEITHIEPTARDVSPTFRVRELIVELEDGQYPQLVKMQMVQDKCDLLDDYIIGEVVKVDFNFRGRALDDGRVFTNIQAWRLARVGSTEVAAPPARRAPPRAAAPAPASHVPAGGDFDDDIPFVPVRGVV